ncbi:hypothetical protein BDK92_7307 [Micromonospora pisi]|uniref:Uncharacterized protein n=1 Tax=Micromonospora pisi TaxID=589240 RepID=A0A495JWA1_9ACTN|nr:hypothetical protein [Micromonospora pisi]RKR92825.1 hypothetical protein BDK92_7307 [Micromonospora pisi]
MNTDTELRWGYTLADLQRVARSAAATTRAMAGDYDDRYAEAFGAAAERLYEAEHWIPEHKLFQAAQDSLWTENRKTLSYRGAAYRNDEGWGESGTGPNFVTYWTDVTRVTPSPENHIVDRLALAQILPTLTERQREVIGALAAFDDHALARAALGDLSCYATHLANARRRFLSYWHEGEVPSRPWGTDRRGANASRLVTVMRKRKGSRKAANDA